jgi:CBS domain-containing protein
MPVSECCNVDVVCCDADTAVTDVAGLMRKHHVGDVVVTENQAGKRVPVGIVTDRDIVIETIALQVDVSSFTAGDLMSMPLATVPEGAGIVETLRMMRSHKVRRLPVVSADGALFGIVTADDLINLLAMELSMMTDTIVDQPLREARLRT